jgi:hypothetical protein
MGGYQHTSTTPYSHAMTGRKARDEITKLLYGAGCSAIGFMDDFDNHALILEFCHRDRKVVLRASAKGWAAMYLRNTPYNGRMKCNQRQYEERALEQGQIAINSILRDWVKGQITAVEAGVFSFDAVFMPFTLLPSGRTVMDEIEGQQLLPGS